MKQEKNRMKSIFGLKISEIQPIIKNIAGKDFIKLLDIKLYKKIPKRHYGFRGKKKILLFTYKVKSGAIKKKIVFVKQHCNKGPNEAIHYKYLDIYKIVHDYNLLPGQSFEIKK